VISIDQKGTAIDHMLEALYVPNTARSSQSCGLYLCPAGLSLSPLFKLKYRIVVFDEVYILFHFNIILKHNRMASIKKASGCQAMRTSFCQAAPMAMSEASSSLEPRTVACSYSYTSAEMTAGHLKMRNVDYTVK
jgi:hypothetical protein